MQFVDLKLSPPILKALAEMGYQTPSPIQEKAIPPVLAGRDLFGCAQTGTGKTCAFAAPILQRLGTDRVGKRPPIRALVLTPTRELALQIYENFVQYGKYLPLRCAVIFGGVSQNPQVEKLQRGVDILVATPGRLNDLIGQGYISLKKVEIFVLDEGDRMLDMGFIHDVRRVVAQLPQERQTLLFSATLPPEIEKLARTILKNPLKVSVTPSATTAEKVSQSLYYVDKPNKKRLLADLLQQPEIESALVFTRTKHGADRVVKELGRAGIEAKAIHGNKSQGARQTALKAFKDRSIRVLVATDIAARGIDIDELSHVINYDLPNEPETYVHRIGRTGRAGLSGTAISFCMFDEIPYLKDIQKLIKQEIPVVKNHPYPMEILEPTPKQPRPPRRERPAPPRQPATRQPGGRPAANGKPAGQGGQRGQNQPRKKK
ncbi:DEAD/DEAH box helicase [Acetanaerobacterium sp. MSJ-12]|uniref:DEAD/DEAH box helicase n=1 Tax=Acetanaerobacterium sp. MSJ-12 TaxID=2841535 RepID=UPI001C0F174F|nr:DEAD/DEAH box helicase [Acetanaerobacterium sp. MSJ-12]MBU5419526.1 DEAD/DEAH box helicase [Acetanaerobacterium sp. MSJ-12]